jgi:cellulose synthase (UDP-forming)
MFGFTALGLVRNLQFFWAVHLHQASIPAVLAVYPVKGLGVSIVWNIYNLVMLTLALLVMLDVPNPDSYEWFDLQRLVRLNPADGDTYGDTPGQLQGKTVRMSQTGMVVALNPTEAKAFSPDTILQAEMLTAGLGLDRNLKLAGKVERISAQTAGETHLEIQFTDLNLAQEHNLVRLLYCRPGQWQAYQSPGELRSLGLLFKALLRPRVVFEHRPQVRAVKVSQG